MTEQTTTTTTAPAAEQTAAPTAPAAAAAAPVEQTTATTSTTTAPEAAQTPEVPDWAKDPAKAIAEVERARREAASARVSSRDQAKADARQELLKELGLTKDDEKPDPAKLASDLAATRTQAADAARELAIFRNAPAGVDVQALLDSRTFLAKVGGIDPTDSTALVAAITEASQGNRFRTVQAPAQSGMDLTGGDQAQRTYTRAQLRDPAFYRANRADIQAAQREGRIR